MDEPGMWYYLALGFLFGVMFTNFMYLLLRRLWR